MQCFAHVPVDEKGLTGVLNLIGLGEHQSLNYDDFSDFMTSDVTWPFDPETSLSYFQAFDAQKTGKLYWAQFRKYLESFGTSLKNPDIFLDYFGTEYFSAGYLDYASYYWNNFSLLIPHTGELITAQEKKLIDRVKEEERLDWASKRKDIETKAKLLYDEKNRNHQDQERVNHEKTVRFFGFILLQVL